MGRVIEFTFTNPHMLFRLHQNGVLIYNIYEVCELAVNEIYNIGFTADELSAFYERVKPILGEYQWNKYNERYGLEQKIEDVRKLECVLGVGSFVAPLLTDSFILVTQWSNNFFFRNQLGLTEAEMSYFWDNIIGRGQWREEAFPDVYQAIKHFNISRELFEEINRKAIAYNNNLPVGWFPHLVFEDWVIDALYCGDENRMRQALCSPYVLFSTVDGNIYNIFEVCDMDAATLYALGFRADELSAFYACVKSVTGESNWNNSDEKYVLEQKVEDVWVLEVGASKL